MIAETALSAKNITSDVECARVESKDEETVQKGSPTEEIFAQKRSGNKECVDSCPNKSPKRQQQEKSFWSPTIAPREVDISEIYVPHKPQRLKSSRAYRNQYTSELRSKIHSSDYIHPPVPAAPSMLPSSTDDDSLTSQQLHNEAARSYESAQRTSSISCAETNEPKVLRAEKEDTS